MGRRGLVAAGGMTLVLTLVGAGLGSHRWAVAHVEHYTADVAWTTNCVPCHFSARGGTVLDRILRPRYRTPLEIASCPGTGRLYVTAQDADALLVVDPATRKVESEIPVGHRPHGVVLNRDCTLAYVTNQNSDSVSVVDLHSGRTAATLPTGFAPAGVALDPSGERLFVANWFGDDISILDPARGAEVTRLAAGKNPTAVGVSPDGRWILVSNQLARPARRPEPPVSEVTLVDAVQGRVIMRHELKNAHLLEGVAFAPEGDLALVTLVRTKNLLPALQVERGWMMTSGFAVVDPLRNRTVQLPLDEVEQFFADPSHVAFTPDGRYAFISHGGVDVVSVVDMSSLRRLLRETDPGELSRFANHLGITRRYVRKRIRTGANPRGLAVSPDGRFVYVAERLDDRIGIIDVERLERVGEIDLGGPRHITLVRRGERVFHSGRYTFQQQFSCRSCHPNSHVDGLAYDFEPDGLGRNLVDNRSLLGLRGTEPFKWNGKNTSLYMQCGIRFARFLMRTEPFRFQDLNALVAYISSLEKPPNRHPSEVTELTPAQERGREIFERSRTREGEMIPVENRCITCHPPPHYTDRIRGTVESASPEDGGDGAFDTPQLNGVAKTAPYLHDGKALTLEEIWTLYSPDDTHGVTGDLGKEGLNDLIDYLKTL